MDAKVQLALTNAQHKKLTTLENYTLAPNHYRRSWSICMKVPLKEIKLTKRDILQTQINTSKLRWRISDSNALKVQGANQLFDKN